MSGGIVAVVVAYRPDIDSVCANLRAIREQVRHCLLVVNGALSPAAEDRLRRELEDAAALMINAGNLGLAYAQNLGIERARQLGAGQVLLLDQDSQPAPGMVKALADALAELQLSGLRPAAIGPRHEAPGEDNVDWPGFVRIRPWGMTRVRAGRSDRPVACDFLIASGSLIPMPVLDAVGGMHDELFIDHIDTEWCLRAKSRGYDCYGLASAQLLHQLGEHRLRVWLGRWRQVAVHRPERYYTIVRNSVWMYRQRRLPLAWKCADGLRNLRLVLMMATVSPQRRRLWYCAWRGFLDGWRGRMGAVGL